MGWDRHKLDIRFLGDDEETQKEFKKSLSKYVKAGNPYFKLKKDKSSKRVHYSMEEDTNWYEFRDDIKFISEKFPDLVIQVDTEIQYDGVDVSRYYYKNGKEQDCSPKYVYKNYDENNF